MKQAVAFEWAEALESGEYEQTFMISEDDGKFCVFGVLNQLAWHAGVVERTPYDTAYDDSYAYDGNPFGAPDSVVEWAGLRNREGKREGQRSLMQLNDSHEASFQKLAEIIRAEWELL